MLRLKSLHQILNHLYTRGHTKPQPMHWPVDLPLSQTTDGISAETGVWVEGDYEKCMGFAAIAGINFVSCSA